MIIKGNVVSGKILNISNSRCLGKDKTHHTQKLNETKKEDCSNIDKIVIESSIANVNLEVTNSSILEAHLLGETIIKGNIKFEVNKVNTELHIVLVFDGNCFSSNLKLNIAIPKKVFNTISIKTTSANVILNEGILSDHLKAITCAGNIEINTSASNIIASTTSGNIDICINAIHDITAFVSAISGNVLMQLNNIHSLDLSASSTCGYVKNRYKASGCYNATIDISVMSGDIVIS